MRNEEQIIKKYQNNSTTLLDDLEKILFQVEKKYQTFRFFVRNQKLLEKIQDNILSIISSAVFSDLLNAICKIFDTNGKTTSLELMIKLSKNPDNFSKNNLEIQKKIKLLKDFRNRILDHNDSFTGEDRTLRITIITAVNNFEKSLPLFDELIDIAFADYNIIRGEIGDKVFINRQSIETEYVFGNRLLECLKTGLKEGKE